MADPNNSGEKLSAAGIRLRRGETAQAALTLTENSAGEGPGNQDCLVLTDKRLFHISGLGDQIKSASLQDITDPELAKKPRYHVFLLPAGYFLVMGFAYFIAVALAGAFQPIVLVPTLLLGGLFIAMWWTSGGDSVIRMKFGDAQLEESVGSEEQKDASNFVDRLFELTG